MEQSLNLNSLNVVILLNASSPKGPIEEMFKTVTGFRDN